MILVDSCVWIDLLKGSQTSAVRRLNKIQADQTPEICISSVIYFEVLRGITSDLERRRVQKALDLLERRDYLNENFELLTALSISARRKGINVPRLGDWLIVKTILDHNLSLLTSDKDFYRLKKVIPLTLESLETKNE